MRMMDDGRNSILGCRMLHTHAAIHLPSSAVSSATFMYIPLRPLDLAEYCANDNLGGFRTGAF